MSKPPDLSKTRIIGIAAHVDAGKTTLTERVLYYAGVSYKIGEVHDGAAHMDYMAEEQAHGITITSAVTKAPWEGHTIQIVDTPGHVDFTVEVERAMRVLDGCVLVLDAVRGVEPQTETVWRQRQKFDLPCLCFVNKMDRPGASFDHALHTMRRRLGAEPLALTVPLPERRAVIHLLTRELLEFEGDEGERVRRSGCDHALWETVERHRESLLLAAAEADEALADAVLTGEEIDPERLWLALRKATLTGQVQPCLGGAALRNYGVQPVLEAVVRLLPAPAERPPSRGHLPDGGDTLVELDAKGPLAALAFKVQLWEGRRHVFARVYRGALQPGDTLALLRPDGTSLKEHVARLFDVDAGKKTRVDRAVAGEIVLLSGLRRASTGDTLCHPDHLMSLERIEAREPVLSLAVEPLASADEEKMLECLDKLLQEDPTLRLEDDPETGQRLLFGMGELHLQIAFERLEREFNLRLRSGRPRVALRETLAGSAVADYLYQPPPDPNHKVPERKARVKAGVRPLDRGTGVRIRVAPRVVPETAQLSPEQLAALEQGARYALSTGPLEGSPLEDLELRVEEVELFGAASPAEAIQAAAAQATRRALTEAGGVLLRPIMAVEVVVPDENLGTVLGDLQSRQALIRDTQAQGDTSSIDCEVALDKLLGYATELRSMTQGRGQFSMQFQRFDTL
jgi:elongation factor G